MGDVERCGRLRRLRRAVWVAVLACACLFLAAGCVETAECNATVSCPNEQVCFEFVCRDICENQEQCSNDETCTPCKDEDDTDEGECFGETLNACVPRE